MSLDPTSPAIDFPADQADSVVARDPPALSKAHAIKIAALFRDEHERLVYHIVARTRSWSEARDTAAQAFAQVLEKQQPETVSFLKAYVYSAARNVVIDRARLRATHNRMYRVMRHESVGTTPSPEPSFVHQQRLQILERAVGALCQTRRMLLNWRFWEELSYAQIESRFAAEGVVVGERTLNRWYLQTLRQLRRAILAEEELPQTRSADKQRYGSWHHNPPCQTFDC